jgi:type I restriction enzyme S subunit
MSSDWTLTTLGSLATIKRGASPRPITDERWFASQGPGWVRIGDVTRAGRILYRTQQCLSKDGASRSVAIVPGDLIMSICATIGKPIISGINACIHDGFVGFFDVDACVLREFLYYFLQFKERELSGKGQPGTQQNLNTGIVAATEILLPPLAEQRKIAAMLSSVDEAIEKTQAVIDQVQVVKKALMQELLTRGLPGRHKKFKQTEIGEIPESWELRLLNDLIDQNRPICYGILKPGKGHPNGIPVVKVKDIRHGEIDDSALLLTTPELDYEYRRSRLRGGDILLTIRGTTGRLAIVPPHLGDANITQDTARIAVTSEHSRDYVRFALEAPMLQLQIAANTVGQAVQGINIGAVRKLLIPVPPQDEQVGIATTFTGIAQRLSRENASLAALRELKQSLMSVLLTGELRVTP